MLTLCRLYVAKGGKNTLMLCTGGHDIATIIIVLEILIDIAITLPFEHLKS